MKITKSHMNKLIDLYKSKKKKPFIVEVLGTPNSGKTTAIQTFEKVLKRNNIACKIIYEAAGSCKIKNKFSPEFNLWTLNETIKQLLDAYTGNYDIVVCERGLLDAICWFNLYHQDKIISTEEYNKIADYILLEKLINKVNCEFIMNCTVEESLYRENLSDILDISGSIVNEVVLTKYNSSLEKVKDEFNNHFEKIEMIDTTDLLQPDINRTFISKIFELIKSSCE